MSYRLRCFKHWSYEVIISPEELRNPISDDDKETGGGILKHD